MHEVFVYRKHLCLVFELLSVNLYELIKQNQFRGLSTNLVRSFTAQILDALTILNEARLIHCDLKPENILLKNLESPIIKVIDFGSACHEQQTVYTYIQSRFYRSPEVLLGLPYSSSIDMWSVGCISVELFLGLPMFPGSSEFNQICRMVETLGLPPTYMLEFGKNSKNFFDRVVDATGKVTWYLKSLERYNLEKNLSEQPSKRYFQTHNLKELILGYPISSKKKAIPAELDREMRFRMSLLDFVTGLLNMNPLERWSPQQARMHPFISGQPLVVPFSPPMEFKPRRQSTVRRSREQLIPQSTQSSMDSTDSFYRRQRANTINSTKLAAIPQQLQKAAAANSGVQQSTKYPSQTHRKPSISSLTGIPPYQDAHYGSPTLASASTSSSYQLLFQRSPPTSRMGTHQPLRSSPLLEPPYNRIASELDHMTLAQGTAGPSRAQEHSQFKMSFQPERPLLASSHLQSSFRKNRSHSVSDRAHSGVWLNTTGGYVPGANSAPTTPLTNTFQFSSGVQPSSYAPQYSQQQVTPILPQMSGQPAVQRNTFAEIPPHALGKGPMYSRMASSMSSLGQIRENEAALVFFNDERQKQRMSEQHASALFSDPSHNSTTSGSPVSTRRLSAPSLYDQHQDGATSGGQRFAEFTRLSAGTELNPQVWLNPGQTPSYKPAQPSSLAVSFLPNSVVADPKNSRYLSQQQQSKDRSS